MQETITSRLREADEIPSAKPAAEFWPEFKQLVEACEREPRRTVWETWRWIPAPLIAAAAALVIAFVYWPLPPEARVLALNVIAEHDAVMMLPTEDGGTIIWIDME